MSVFTALKILLSLVALGAFVWFGFTVNLGDRTFFGHVRAIAGSRESQELISGTKERVGELIGKGDDKTNGKPGKTEGKAVVRAAGKSADKSAEKSGDKSDGKADEKKHLVGTHPVGPPQEELTDGDRQDMRRLLEGRARSGAAKTKAGQGDKK